ncbi:MAG: hypothetical protein IBJ11_10335 [Phycisphaerales bacterium]|nr:hypothetical protein [Phycisphaerales bacterium]
MPSTDGPGTPRRTAARATGAGIVPGAWAFSLAAHASVVLLAFFIVWTVAAPRDDRPPVTVSFEDPGPAGVALVTPPDSPAAALSPDTPTAPVPPDASPAPSLSDEVARLTAAPLEPVLPDPAPPAPASRPLAAPAPPAALLAERRLPEVRFAGLGASNAERIVYVVDASGAMISSFPIVRDELRKSVSRLAPTQEFQVVFFRAGEALAAPHPADQLANQARGVRLIRAGKSNLSAVSAWLDTVQPEGRSAPAAALEIALSLRPDAVFLLSSRSGAFTGGGGADPASSPDALLALLERLNPANPSGRRPAVIKAIQFLNDDPSGTLRKIAERHAGTGGYTFISRQELKVE